MLSRRSFSLLPAAAYAQAPAPAPELVWHDAKEFTIEGLGFKDTLAPYDRLPGRAEAQVPKPVWDLSHDSSGVVVRFRANTPALYARWTLTRKNLAGANITAVAASGLDLYAQKTDGSFGWAGIGRPAGFPESSDVLAPGLPPGEREYRIYFPLRNGVTKLEIGVPKDASVSKAAARPAGRKPIVFYGTSITHGISASRPGMPHPAILGRRFDREFINLGFSGNGRMEKEMIALVAEIDAAVFVLDCLPNMGPALVRERVEPGVIALRKAHPKTPILLVEDRNYADNPFNPKRQSGNEGNHAALQEVYGKLQASGVPYLAYLPAENLLGEDREDTVDGSHPTDLGFLRQADGFTAVLRQWLK